MSKDSAPWSDPELVADHPDQGDPYASLPASKAKVDKDPSQLAVELEGQLAKLRQLHVRRVERDQDRAAMFFAMIITLLVIAWLSCVAVLIYLGITGKLDGTVAIAFLGGVGVQTIGLAYIVARYFFPEGAGATEFPALEGND